MRQHLHTLCVTTEDAWLHKDGENAVVKVDGIERGRVPVHLLGSIVCIGSIGVTPALMGPCAERGVRISMMGRNGRFLARIEGPVSDNVVLRRSQYRWRVRRSCNCLVLRHDWPDRNGGLTCSCCCGRKVRASSQF